MCRRVTLSVIPSDDHSGENLSVPVKRTQGGAGGQASSTRRCMCVLITHPGIEMEAMPMVCLMEGMLAQSIRRWGVVGHGF